MNDDTPKPRNLPPWMVSEFAEVHFQPGTFEVAPPGTFQAGKFEVAPPGTFEPGTFQVAPPGTFQTAKFDEWNPTEGKPAN